MQTPRRVADNEEVAGTLHQGLLLVLQDDLWLAFDLLGLERPCDGRPIDRRAEVERDGGEPLTIRTGFPDLVMVHRDPSDTSKGLVITVEAQTASDLDKRWMIPVYQSHLAEEHRLETWSVVVALSRGVSSAIARWREGGPPRVDVLLLDVDSVPRSPWLDHPARRPLAAVLAGALHGFAGDFDAARRGFHAARMLEHRRRRHGMTILAALTEDQRKQLIGELPVQEQHEWMDVERRSGTYQFGREEGREEGRRAALRDLVFACIEERALALDDASEARIRSCDHLPTLQRWAQHAMLVATVPELFELE